MSEYKMWINGEFVDAKSGKTYPVINPANGEEIAQLPLGGPEDVDIAVEAAATAFAEWSKTPVAKRCQTVKQIARGIRENVDELTRIDILDHGTPAMMAKFMTLGAAGNLDFAADAARTMMSEMIPASSDTLTYLRREPIGVCALITPWNAPLMMILDKLGSALATGNTCVIKPPSIDSMEALKLAEIIDKVGLPKGTVNILSGPGGSAGDTLSKHPKVSKISFTGSCETGKVIMANAAITVKNVGMELGGKNPFIVLKDADLTAAVGKAAMVQYLNTGMICAAPGRIYVHESLYNEFLDKFVEGSRRVITGNPNDPKTTMGPVVSEEHRDSVEYYIKAGISEGARLLLGGERPVAPPLDKGFYVLPTVFADVTPDMKIYREEIFGPVACISKFSDEEEVIKAANDNVFALCASVWTTDAAKGIRFANELQAGTVWINDHLVAHTDIPWGGFKESGFGKVSGMKGVEEFVQEKLIWIDLYNGTKPHFPPA